MALTSLIYLLKRDEAWNRAALTAAELGVLFISLTLIAGSLWARPIWNVWWTWDSSPCHDVDPLVYLRGLSF